MRNIHWNHFARIMHRCVVVIYIADIVREYMQWSRYANKNILLCNGWCSAKYCHQSPYKSANLFIIWLQITHLQQKSKNIVCAFVEHTMFQQVN